MGTTTQALSWTRDSGAGEVSLITPSDKVVAGNAALSTSAEAAIETRRDDAFDVLPRIEGIRTDNTPENPVEGGVAYDTKASDSGFRYYNGTVWALAHPEGQLFSHSNLSGLTQHDHPQYVLSVGQGCCQTIYGGEFAEGDLTLISNTTTTKGTINFGNSVYDDTLHRLGINMQGGLPAHTLDVNGDFRVQSLGTGLIRADNGILSIDGGAATGQWGRATSPIPGVHPIQSNDGVFVGAGATSSLASKCYIQGNSADGASEPIMAVRSGGSMGADEAIFAILEFNSSGRRGGWFNDGSIHLGVGVRDTNLSIENDTGNAANPLPVLTTAQRDALSGQPNGAMVWNSDTDKVNVWVTTEWHAWDTTVLGG